MAAAVLALAIIEHLGRDGTCLRALGFRALHQLRVADHAKRDGENALDELGNGDNCGNGALVGGAITTITAIPTAVTNLPIDTTFTTAGDLGSRMTMTRATSDIHTGMIQITLKITWTTSDRRTLSRTYITYYGQNGLYDFFAA